MAMEVIQIINAAHEDALAGIAYNPINRQVYTCAEGDKAIKVWDLKTGQLLRTQTVHRGMVTCLAYATSAKLLFSGSIDGSIGVWTDKGNLLQVVSTGWPVFSVAWGHKQHLLVAGGNSVLHVFKVDMSDVLRVKHARQSSQPSGRQQQQSGASGSEPAGMRAPGLAADMPQILKRVCPVLRGWKQHHKGAAVTSSKPEPASPAPSKQDLASSPVPDAPAEATAPDSAVEPALAPSTTGPLSPRPHTGSSEPDTLAVSPYAYAESEAAVSSTTSMGRPRAGGRGAGVNGNRQQAREEDYFGVCHTDVVKCIVITDGGKIFTAGYDRCLCIYDIDKLDKPKEAYTRVKDCGKAGITSLTFDPHNNVLLAGSLDGVLRVWSVEGRCLDRFEGLSNQPVCVAYLPHTNHWWATGRFSKVAALDPHALALITEYVAAPNQLTDHAVQLLYAPPGTDLVMASSHKRQLLVWQYNPHAAHRVFCGHQDWIESLVVCGGKDNSYDQSFLSCSADGHLCCWELDAEQNCDVFRLVEDTRVVPCNVLCLLHLPGQQQVMCGCDDGTIRLHTLDRHLPPAAASSGAGHDAGSGLLPPVWTGHEGKVTGLVLVSGDLLLSCSEDRSLRVWDLRTSKQLHVELDAHDSGIQCLEYCPARKQAATCGMGSKVKVWSFSKPTQPLLVVVLDHSEKGSAQQQQPAGGGLSSAASTPAAAKVSDVNPDGTSNMRWLIKSELAEGAGQVASHRQGAPALPDIVAEAIAHAAEDVPEVTQVRWVGFRDCWVTAADDELLRMWSTAGKKTAEYAFKGGACRCLYVCNANKLLLAATADKSAHVFDLSTGFAPLARFQGHTDIISGIGYLPTPLDCYVTSSWDKQIRLWKRPLPSTSSDTDRQQAGSSTTHAAGATSSTQTAGGKADSSYLLPEDSEEGSKFVSEYEKAHPLVAPKALSQAIGVSDSAKAGGRRAGGRGGRSAAREARFSDEGSLCGTPEAADPPGSLGAKLQELGRRLLQDINEMSTKGCSDRGQGPPAGVARSNSNKSNAQSVSPPLRRVGTTCSRKDR